MRVGCSLVSRGCLSYACQVLLGACWRLVAGLSGAAKCLSGAYPVLVGYLSSGFGWLSAATIFVHEAVCDAFRAATIDTATRTA